MTCPRLPHCFSWIAIAVALSLTPSLAQAAGGATVPELPNVFSATMESLPEDSEARHFLHEHFHNGWDNVFFSFLAVGIAWAALHFGMRKRIRQPGRYQGAIEAVSANVFDFFKGVMGEKNAREFLPLIGALFVYILFINLFGIVPLFKAPTSTWKTTFALSIPTLLIVQYVGITRSGVLGRLHHLAGEPRDAAGWILSPLMLLLETVGEIAKAVSLALRLFGNILGKDILLGAFAMMGVMLMGLFVQYPMVGAGVHLGFLALVLVFRKKLNKAIFWGLIGYVALVLIQVAVSETFIGIPLQFPFLFLALLLSAIQALVFSLLSAIYIMMALPHEEGH